MSVFDTDLAFMLTDAPNSVEVSFGNVQTSGILDYEDQITTDDNGQSVQVRVTTLRIGTAVLDSAEDPLEEDDPITAGGKNYLVRQIGPTDDGAISLLYIAELK